MRRDPRWRGMSAGMVRASEVISPAPAGHFLRQFGQSDREIISSSTEEASISQALRLLNGSSRMAYEAEFRLEFCPAKRGQE